MYSKSILSVLVMLGTIASAATALGGEAKLHDHQQTKTHIESSNTTEEATGPDCVKTIEAEDGNEVSNVNSPSKENVACDQKPKVKPRHDHRKSKNL
jgi:hypothetical protein